MMTLTEAMSALQAAGSEQTRKTYARHGVKDEMFGVSYAVLEKLRKKIKADQKLAEDLWNTGNHDAKILACMVADPAQATVKSLSAWTRGLEDRVVACAVASLAGRTSAACACFEKWKTSKNDFVSSAAWTVLSGLAVSDETIPDDYFADQLQAIEQGIRGAKNWTRYAMNGALIAIGSRNPRLEKLAIPAAGRIGKVEVDHGDTNCKTPDAVSYIRKTAAYKKAKGKQVKA